MNRRTKLVMDTAQHDAQNARWSCMALEHTSEKSIHTG